MGRGRARHADGAPVKLAVGAESVGSQAAVKNDPGAAQAELNLYS